MTADIPDPQSFIEMYSPDARVVFGENIEMTLAQALQFEALQCKADSADRQNAAKRVGYLARKLAAGGSLLPEHAYLLGEGE